MTYSIETEYELPVTVEYRITSRGYPQTREEPAEPPEFEITLVLVCGAPVLFHALPDLVCEDIEDTIRTVILDVIGSERSAVAEYRAEWLRDAP